LVQRTSLLTLFPGRISYSPVGRVFCPTTKLKGISVLASVVTDCARAGYAVTKLVRANATTIVKIEFFITISFFGSQRE
jgi:hypothetical protein